MRIKNSSLLVSISSSILAFAGSAFADYDMSVTGAGHTEYEAFIECERLVTSQSNICEGGMSGDTASWDAACSDSCIDNGTNWQCSATGTCYEDESSS